MFTTEGVTLTQIAALRATRDNPRYSVMFMDDIGIELSKREGLIDPLPADKIPNLAGVLPRFLFFDGYGAAFAISTGGLVINPQVTKPLATYAELWEPRFKQRYLMTTPKFTQSLYLLIATASLVTGKPLKEAQYEIDAAWPKMAELKTQRGEHLRKSLAGHDGGARPGRHRRHRVFEEPLSVHRARRAAGHVLSERGHLRRHQLPELRQGRPGTRSRRRVHQSHAGPSVQQGLATATLTSPSVKGATFAPDIAQIHRLSRIERWTRWVCSPPTGPISIRAGQDGWRNTIRCSGAEGGHRDLRRPEFAAPPRTRSTTVRLNELSKRYGTQLAVDALSLTIEPGSMLALLGPSGCGKTTCLRMIAGLVQPTSGEIFIDGKRITGTPVHRRNIGMLFQNYALFPHMTVAENVAFGLEARRLPKAETTARVAGACNWCSWAVTPIACPRNCRAASSNAWRSRAAWWWSRRCCCSMSLWARWTRACAKACRSSCARCNSGSASPRSW